MTRYAIYDAAGRMVEGTEAGNTLVSKGVWLFSHVDPWKYKDATFEEIMAGEGVRCLPVPASEPGAAGKGEE